MKTYSEKELMANSVFVDAVETAYEGTTCNCGGIITFSDGVMLCSKCKYGASFTIKIDDPVLMPLTGQGKAVSESGEGK